MPTEVKKLDDGTYEVKLESGEIFKGDALEVMQKQGDAQTSTKRWGQNARAELENVKARNLAPPEPVQPVQQPTNGNADETALQNYLLDQTARSLGFKDGAEYKQRMEFVANVADQSANNQIAESFMLACPEFPSTPESVDRLTKKIDDMGWGYNQQSLMAAHLMCVREGAYKPLTNDEVNASWANQMQQSSQPANGGRPIPPTPPQGSAPGGLDNQNPWSMSKDDLRKKVLEGGGLGAALMALKPGETFGS